MHEEALPAWFDSGPGQCSGSGATRAGAFLRGAERSTSSLEGVIGSSREGGIANVKGGSTQGCREDGFEEFMKDSRDAISLSKINGT